MNVLVIAPHPDDEILGVGGTIRLMAGQGHRVVVAIVTKGWAPLFPDRQVAQVRAEAERANELLGSADLRFLDLPVTKLNTMSEAQLNGVFADLIADVKPDWVFLPFRGDRHEDHRQIFDAAMVALRPTAANAGLKMVLAYETISETHWAAPGIEANFVPNYFIDITDHLTAKCQAMRVYASQLKPAPDARSVEAIASLATFRGSTVTVTAAEAFMLVRGIYHDAER